MVKNICAALLLVVFLVSCKSNENGNYRAFTSDPLLYCRTVKQLNNVVLENNFPPMIASRNYAYATIAAYEVIIPFDKRFQSLAGQTQSANHLMPIQRSNIYGAWQAMLARSRR